MAKLNEVERLHDFLIKNLDNLIVDGGSGSLPTLPHFDLYAQDYLTFAEVELQSYQNNTSQQDHVAHLINCVSHLKRAIDCQLDTFLHAYNLYDTFQKRNLKLEKKLDFLGAAGIFNSRSLTRLNTIRNKMEHTFNVPEIQEIEVYYDLITAFVAILQRTIIMTLNSEVWLYDGLDPYKVYFQIKYLFEKPIIIAKWQTDEEKVTLECGIEEFNEFTYFLKILFLLYQKESFASKEYVLSQL
jgi:hypothetical protein